MKRVEVQLNKGKKIVVVDVSSLTGKDIIQVLTEAKPVIAGMGEKNAFILTDVTDAKYDKEVAEAIKDFTKFNTPYVKGSAVVGASGVQLVLLQTVVFITRRDIKIFNTRPDAIAWFSSLER
jgi:hypothetical protein